MKLSSSFILPCSLLILTGCSRQSSLLKKKVMLSSTHHHKNPDRTLLTIWVHGTRFFKSNAYSTYFNNAPGLKPAYLVGPETHLFQVAHTLHSFYPEEFPLEHFYIFGWSGKLNEREREESADVLQHELRKIIALYKKRHDEVYVRVFTHSHGGNLVLYLAKDNSDILIDELILMGCPVQANTMDYVQSPMFKQVYSLYSSLDYVQVIAPQVYRNSSCKPNRQALQFPPLSEKRFPAHKRLTQAKIKVNGRSLWHSSFVQEEFLSTLPTVLASLKEWDTTLLEEQKINQEQLLCVYNTA